MSERPPALPKLRRRWFQYSLRTLLLVTLLCAIALKGGLEWQRQRRMKIARNWANACLDQEYPDCGRMKPSGPYKPWPALPTCPAALDESERRIVLQMAVAKLESPRQRIAGLRILVESAPGIALEVLREALPSERDSEVKAAELRLVGLCRDATAAEMVLRCMDDADAGVRAAAADALGLIHCPAYPVKMTSFIFFPPVFNSDPSQGKPPAVRTVEDSLPSICRPRCVLPWRR